MWWLRMLLVLLKVVPQWPTRNSRMMDSLSCVMAIRFNELMFRDIADTLKRIFRKHRKYKTKKPPETGRPRWEEDIKFFRTFSAESLFNSFFGVLPKSRMLIYQRFVTHEKVLKSPKRRVQDLNLRAHSTWVRRISSPMHYHSANSPCGIKWSLIQFNIIP